MGLSYHIIQHDMTYSLAQLQVQALIDHHIEKEIDAYLDHDRIKQSQHFIKDAMDCGGGGFAVSYHNQLAGYILGFDFGHALCVNEFYARKRKALNDPSCPYRLGQSLLHTLILHHPHVEEISLNASQEAWAFYREAGFKIYNPDDKYDMVMPRNHIEKWLDTPLHGKAPQFNLL